MQCTKKVLEKYSPEDGKRIQVDTQAQDSKVSSKVQPIDPKNDPFFQ